MTDTKTCVQCGKEFSRRPRYDLKKWAERKFCTFGCSNIFKVAHYVRKTTPCRICGKPTRYYTRKNLVHCENPECAKISRELKNKNISQKAVEMYADGTRKKIRHAWENVPRISQNEKIISPWLESLGFTPQYSVLTGVHTNKLPRMFRLDFALPEHKLYIEIDGSVHRLRKDRDERRNKMLSDLGWTGNRIKSELIQEDIESVKQIVMNFIEIMRQR